MIWSADPSEWKLPRLCTNVALLSTYLPRNFLMSSVLQNLRLHPLVLCPLKDTQQNVEEISYSLDLVLSQSYYIPLWRRNDVYVDTQWLPNCACVTRCGHFNQIPIKSRKLCQSMTNREIVHDRLVILEIELGSERIEYDVTWIWRILLIWGMLSRVQLSCCYRNQCLNCYLDQTLSINHKGHNTW